jgi:hypothetical protein
VSDHDDPRINPRELAAFLAPGSTPTPDGRGLPARRDRSNCLVVVVVVVVVRAIRHLRLVADR